MSVAACLTRVNRLCFISQGPRKKRIFWSDEEKYRLKCGMVLYPYRWTEIKDNFCLDIRTSVDLKVSQRLARAPSIGRLSCVGHLFFIVSHFADFPPS